MKKLSNMTEQQIEEALASNAQRQRPHPPEELDLIKTWTNRVLVDVSLLEMAITGNVGVQVIGGEVKFNAIKSPRGWKPRPPRR